MKYCKDCRHYFETSKKENNDMYKSFCQHEMANNLVTGQNAVTPAEMRYGRFDFHYDRPVEEGLCGREGKLWEKKD